MSKIKKEVLNKLQQFQIESQTKPLKNASLFLKILALIYKLIGRKTIAKSLTTSSNCNGCGICVKICPNNAIKIKRNIIIRSNKCKGCLMCVYSCPTKAFELPVISLIGVFILLFLPYDTWMIKILSINIVSNMMSVKYLLISLILWFIGYAIALIMYREVFFILSTFPIFKKLGKISIVKKMRNKIHPALIFPAIISMKRDKQDEI